MKGRLITGCVFLFLSGLCALVYQIGWIRELRLVFGASSLAVSLVLAIFMGGIGFGMIFFGRKGDTSRHPLLKQAAEDLLLYNKHSTPDFISVYKGEKL